MDQQRADGFAEKLVGILNSGALALMVAIGHRTRLFDTMSEMDRGTSAEIAAKAGLNERYVREWLGAMVAGGVVTYDPSSKTYRLPPEHAASLVRAAGSGNIAVLGQYISQLGSVEDEIVSCFERGGGVPYSSYKRFHAIMAEDSGQSVLPALVSGILPLVPGMVERLEKGAAVLDVGCGAGRALTLMAKTYPNSSFLGKDFSEEAIATARAEAKAQGVQNVRFEVEDAARMSDRNSYDLITTFDTIHDQGDPAKVLSNIAAALKPDGYDMMQDIDASADVSQNVEHPIGPLLYTISCLHCMTVSLAQGGAGLGAMWGRETANRMLGETGLDIKGYHRLPHDIQNAYWVSQRKLTQ
jgi:2-polyprenyl-3-methyl-5-hydroxy-6-metoxy-1,4-benzoquinol methylase